MAKKQTRNYPLMTITMPPPERAEIKAAAKEHFDGNQSLLLRTAFREWKKTMKKSGKPA